MKTKGAGILSLMEYMRKYYPDKYDEWIEKLPESSKKLCLSKIMQSKMYPVEESLFIPTKVISEITGQTIEKISYDSAILGVENALTGFLRIITKINTIAFLVNRVKTFYHSYYDKGKVQVLQVKKNSSDVLVWEIPKEYEFILWRIYGWMYAVISQKTKEIISHDLKIIQDADGKTVRGELTISWR